jgi:hypothetical protein
VLLVGSEADSLKSLTLSSSFGKSHDLNLGSPNLVIRSPTIKIEITRMVRINPKLPSSSSGEVLSAASAGVNINVDAMVIRVTPSTSLFTIGPSPP